VQLPSKKGGDVELAMKVSTTVVRVHEIRAYMCSFFSASSINCLG